MTETFNVGDLVEAVKGETVVRGRVENRTGPDTAALLGIANGLALSHYRACDFTVTVIEKALPPLPTELGWYTDKTGGLWAFKANGYFALDAGNCVGWFSAQLLQEEYAPFTRLASVAEVLKKVRNFCAECGELEAIAAEYGVTL